MSVTGIYPVGATGLHLSDDEIARLASHPSAAATSRPANHAELHEAIVAMARRNSLPLELEMVGTGFMAVIAGDLRVVANVRGRGEETFYCQGESSDLLHQLAEEIAASCGPQIVLPATGEDGVLVLPKA